MGIIIVAKVLVIFFYVKSDRTIFHYFYIFSIGKLSIVFGKDFLHEGAVWNLITTHTGITLEQCMQNQQEYLGEETLIYKKSNARQIKRAKKLSSSAQNLISKILEDFEIDSQLIDIVPYKGKGSPAAADDWTLFIDETDLFSYPVEAHYFVIGHELIHIKYKDHSIHSALHRLVPKKNKKIRTILAFFDRFQEIRADALAMLKGDIYIQGCISFLNLLQEREGENFESSSHPKTADRIVLAQVIKSNNNKALFMPILSNI